MDSIHSESSKYELSYTESVYTSSSSVLLPTTPSPQPYEQRRAFRIGSWEFSLFWSVVLLAVIATGGKFGEGITLALWLNSIDEKNSSAPTLDSYFVLSFTSLSFVVIFGVCLLFIRVFSPRDLGDNERSFSHLLLFLVGLCDALNGVLVIFSSKNLRTPLYLQVILVNFLIPSTILFRKLILRKKPTRKKLLCAVIVTVAPVICIIPKFVPSLQSKHGKERPKTDAMSNVLWPLILTLGFVLGAITFVFVERGLKMQNEMSRRGVNLVYFLFWVHAYQFLCIAALFWVDILPWFGNTHHGIYDFGTNWWFGIQCFFGAAAGCDATSGIRGTMYILMNVLFFVGAANLLRHAEGATWLAIVVSLATPMESIFWAFFSEVPFKWQPDDDWGINILFAVGAILVMLPAVLIYHKGAPEISMDDVRSRRRRK